MSITFQVKPTEDTFSRYHVIVTLDNDYSIRKVSFSKWESAFEWLRQESNRRQDPAGRDLWNYTIKVK